VRKISCAVELSRVDPDSVAVPDVSAGLWDVAEAVVEDADSDSLSSLHAATPKTVKPTRAMPATLLRKFICTPRTG
jgi:hypothetical protein